jgi:hypothetical protein
MAEYGHQWSRNIEPQHDEKHEQLLAKEEF